MNESVVKTLMVSFVICLLCSLVVSFAAVGLRDIQIENKLNDQRIKILQAGKSTMQELMLELNLRISRLSLLISKQENYHLNSTTFLLIHMIKYSLQKILHFLHRYLKTKILPLLKTEKILVRFI